MTTWHYAPSVEIIDGEEVWTVREVYRNAAGEITMWSFDPDAPQGDSRDELIRCLEMMLADVRSRDTFPVAAASGTREDGDARAALSDPTEGDTR